VAVEVLTDSGPPLDVAALEADGQRLLEALGLGECELSVVLGDDAFVQELNARWRHVHAPTDVLSFPQDDRPVLGDVVIGTETAARQAAEHGHALEVEVRVLLVHGLLHLLGHDHERGEGLAGAMRGEETRLLAVLAIAPEVALVGRGR
jgi:probable rRNA maturation factor